MNFLGMGPMELMLILVLALIVFGPGKLPEVAGQVGKAVRDLRRATTDLSSEFNRTLSLEVEEKKEAAAAAPAPSVAAATTAVEAEPATVSLAPIGSVPAPGPATTVPEPAVAIANGASSADTANEAAPPLTAPNSWHWEEPWKPNGSAAAAAALVLAGDLPTNPYMVAPAMSESAHQDGNGAPARKDPSDLAPPY